MKPKSNVVAYPNPEEKALYKDANGHYSTEKPKEDDTAWQIEPDPKGSKLIKAEFANPQIKVGKEFTCPTCGVLSKVTREQILNAASGVVSMAPLYAEFAGIVKKYPNYRHYIEYRLPLLRVSQKMGAISNGALSIRTSVMLPCNHTVDVAVEYIGKDVQQPNATNALLELGVKGKDCWKWLSYIYTGQVSEVAGKKKVEEITAIVNAYKTEIPALEQMKSELREKIPASITGLDGKIFEHLSSDIETITKELKTTLQSVVNEIDGTLTRVARRPDGALPDRSWVVKGDA